MYQKHLEGWLNIAGSGEREDLESILLTSSLVMLILLGLETTVMTNIALEKCQRFLLHIDPSIITTLIFLQIQMTNVIYSMLYFTLF